MDAARKLNVSLLTVSPVSHSVSQSGVLSLFPARNQFLSRLWFVGMPDCCVTLFVDETNRVTQQVSRANCASYVVELATIVIAGAVSLL